MKLFKKILIGVGLFFVVIIGLGAAMVGMGYQPTESQSIEQVQAPVSEQVAQENYEVGDTIVIDDLKYTANGVWLYDALGNSYVLKEPDGVFLVVDVSIENPTKGKKYILYDYFKITDSQERTYDVNLEAFGYLRTMGFDTLTLDDIGPGLKKENVYFAFDIPKNDTELKLKIKPGFFADSKYVNIGDFNNSNQ